MRLERFVLKQEMQLLQIELLHVTENRYSGIPTMRSEFANAGLPAPLFSVVHGEFKVVMKNGLFTETMPFSDSLIEFRATPRTRAEIVAFVVPFREDKSRHAFCACLLP